MPASPQSIERADPLLARAERAASAALRELPEALIIVFDRELRVVLSAGQLLTRASRSSFGEEGQRLADAFPADLWTSIQPILASALEGETRSREIVTADERRCLMIDAGPLPESPQDAEAPGGAADGAAGVAVLLDVTGRRRAEMLAGEHDRSTGQVDRPATGTGLLDADGRWLLVSRPLCDITGYTAEELLGTRFDGIVHPEDAENDARERARLLAGEISALQAENRYFDAAGETVTAILSMSLVRDRQGVPRHYVAQLQDISDRRRFEQSVLGLADHDPLTGLRNRRLFQHDLMLQVARSQRYGETAGLLVIDVESFAELNERHGEAVGEEVLRALARALTRRLRQTDLVARLGADEFAVLLPHIDCEGITVVADGLTRVIPAYSVDTGSAVVHPAASIGSAIVDRRTASGGQALAEAYRAVQIARYARQS